MLQVVGHGKSLRRGHRTREDSSQEGQRGIGQEDRKGKIPDLVGGERTGQESLGHAEQKEDPENEMGGRRQIE